MTETALATARDTGPDAAAGLLGRAEAAYRSAVGDPLRAGQELPGLLQEIRRARATEPLVVALRALAWCERLRLSADSAKQHLDEAARVARRSALPERLADVLVTRAAVNHDLGRLLAAQRDLDTARSLRHGRPGADLDLQQAVLHHNTGRLQQAAELYRRMLADPATPADIAAKVGNNLALIEAGEGRHRAALAHLDQAAERAASAGPALVAIVEHSRAWVTVQSGRLTEGLRLLDRAAALHEAAGVSLGEHYLEHSDALVDLRLLPEAGQMAQRAAEEFDAAGVGLMAAEARLRQARIALLSADHEAAVLAARRAAEGFRRQRRGSWRALSTLVEVQARSAQGVADRHDLVAVRNAAGLLQRVGMRSWAVEAHLVGGQLAAQLGRAAAARRAFADAGALGSTGPVLVRLRARVATAADAALRGADAEVLAHCRTGLTDLARHRAALPSLELRALASGHGAELGRLGLAALRSGGTPVQVLDWLERTRAAALLPSEATADARDVDLGELRSVHEELAAVRSATGQEPAELLDRLVAAEARVRRAAWSRDARSASTGGRLDLAALRRALAGRPLVEYGVDDGRLLAVVVTARRARIVPLGPADPVAAEAEMLLFALRRLSRGGRPASARSALESARLTVHRLAAMLVEPLGLPAGAPVVVVPTPGTQRLPWSALHSGPVALAPSAGSWLRTAQRTPPTDGAAVLVAGPGLPGAAQEVEALARLHPHARVLAPPHSTVGAVGAAIESARLAHLACHGRIRVDSPAFSSLLLTGGELTVQELDLRGPAPYRIVLSACDSGAQSVLAGDEQLGFVSALFARGAAGLLASVVLVPDADVVPLMCGVHERLLDGATLADALHAARAQLDLDQPASFAAACAFNAFGAA